MKKFEKVSAVIDLFYELMYLSEDFGHDTELQIIEQKLLNLRHEVYVEEYKINKKIIFKKENQSVVPLKCDVS